MAEVIVFQGPDGSQMSYHSVKDSTAVRHLSSQPGFSVVKRFEIPSGGGTALETPVEAKAKRQVESMAPVRQRMMAQAIPPVAATIATAMVPEAMPLAWAARPVAAGIAGMVSDPAKQALAGGKPSMRSSALTGAEMFGGQVTGEALSLLAGMARNGLATRTFATAPEKLFRREIANESRIAGQPLSPGEAGLGRKMLQEGVAPGKAPWEKAPGSKIVAGRLEDAAKKRDAILSSPGVAGNRFTSYSFVGPHVKALRAELSRLGDPKMMAWLDNRLMEFHDGFRLPSGKSKRFSPLETQKELLSTWDDAARPIHEARDNARPSPSPEALREARFMKAVADDARMRLRALTPPAHGGGVGALERANQDIYRLQPLHDALVRAEIPKMHTDAGLTAAGSGLGVLAGLPGGGAGMAEGASTGALLAHLMAQPAVSGRVANALNRPWIPGVARQAPMAGDAALRMLIEKNRQRQ